MNVLTVDVEEWYHSNALNIPQKDWGHYRSTVARDTVKLLDLFDIHQVKATFFILGCVAKNHPSLVKEIINRGHEIGSHGLNHRLISQMSLDEFTTDLDESLAILEDIIQSKILYYRAPSWSISKDMLDVLFILEEKGIVCDSSLQPFQTPLSGIYGLPSEPYIPILRGRELKLIEFPPTVCSIFHRVKLPFAGGFYFRLFPFWFIQGCLKNLNHKRAGMVYIHPWEINPNIPKLENQLHINFVQYYGLKDTFLKLENLLNCFSFSTLGNVIKTHQYPKKNIG